MPSSVSTFTISESAMMMTGMPTSCDCFMSISVRRVKSLERSSLVLHEWRAICSTAAWHSLSWWQVMRDDIYFLKVIIDEWSRKENFLVYMRTNAMYHPSLPKLAGHWDWKVSHSWGTLDWAIVKAISCFCLAVCNVVELDLSEGEVRLVETER